MRFLSGVTLTSSEQVSADYIQINNCGLNEIDSFDMTTYRPDGRADYLLLYVWHGSLLLRANDQEIEVPEGSLVLYLPWETQDYTYRAELNTRVYWLHFTGQGIPSLLQKSFLWGQRVTNIGINPDLKELFEKIIRELQLHRYQYEMYLCSYFLTLLACASRQLMNSRNGIITRNQEVITQAIGYIHEHLYDTLCIDDLARMSNMSQSHFLHQFHDFTGFSPHAYQTRLRMENAKDMMLSTTLNISEIARATGYDNPLYFSRLFHRYTGLSPSAYREHLTGQ